jgi:hypothetical protein
LPTTTIWQTIDEFEIWLYLKMTKLTAKITVKKCLSNDLFLYTHADRCGNMSCDNFKVFEMCQAILERDQLAQDEWSKTQLSNAEHDNRSCEIYFKKQNLKIVL